MVYCPAKSESNPRWILAAILLLLPISAVFADSGQGAQPGRGYALNPHGILPGLTPDPNGLNPLSRGTRTPAGFLYGQPWQPPSLAPLSSTDWLYDLSFEVGYLATTGDTDSARFREYADMNEGTFVPGFALLAEEPGSGRYLEAYGGAVGRSDEYYQFDFGKAGYYRFSAFYNSIPHEFARGVPVLWNGVGSERLELPPELTPGGSTAVAVRDAFDAADNSRLSLERDEAGVSVRIMPLESLDLFASASSEERDGTRPFGGAFTFPFLGQVTESVEPIDYTTNEVSAGIHYIAELLQANLIYTGSWFRNDKDTLVWESPGLATIPGDFIPGEGRFALAPDNDYHNIRLDLAAPLPWWRGRYSVSAAYSNMRQDDDLRPPTISSATIAGATGPINLDLWNTVDALSRRKADAEIEARMLHGRLQLQPLRLLRLGAEMRLHYQHNKTDYTAFNPLTGDYGYIALDGGLGADIPSLSGVFEPDFPGSRVRYRSIPFDKDTSRLGLTADYRLGRKSSLGLSAEHEEADYNYRERDTVEDDRIRLQLTRRGPPWGTLRLAYEFARRTGDDYNSNPYDAFYTSSLPEYQEPFPDGDVPSTLSAMRKYDLASRDRHLGELGVNLVIGTSSDIAISARYTRDDFSADYGLRNDSALNLNGEWSYRLSTTSDLHAFYSYQYQDRTMRNITDAGPIGTDPTPGGSVYPLENAWTEDIEEINHVAGLGARREFGRWSVEAEYLLVLSRSDIDYDYASTGAFLDLYPAAEAGSGFPDQDYHFHRFETKLRLDVNDKLNVRLFYRLEKEDIDDFHYEGMQDPVIGNDIYLLAEPADYTAHIIGATLELKF